MSKYIHDSDHTVYINSKGEEVPSATTVLKMLNKPALVKWANFLGFNRQNVDDVLNEYAERGTLIHELISSYLHGDLIVYIDDNRFDPLMVLKFFNCFKVWYQQHTIEPILLEKSFCSDKFGGTVDFYGKIDGVYTLLDFKTAKKIRLSMILQLALYVVLLEQNGYIIEQVGILLVNPGHKNEKYISRKDIEQYIIFAEKLVDMFHLHYTLVTTNKWDNEIY